MGNDPAEVKKMERKTGKGRETKKKKRSEGSEGDELEERSVQHENQ